MKVRQYYVYIMTNYGQSVLYVGVTNNIRRRVEEHRMSDSKHFVGRYRVFCLVYFEKHKYINRAIKREKQIKRWKREWKEDLINKNNPAWKEISP